MSGFAATPSLKGAKELDARSDSVPRGLRADIEGLRTVAVGLVLVYHAGIHLVPGGFIGVDVFFVISGFLITGMLMREVSKTGRVSIVTFYARRMKRLLPASTLVLLITAALTWWIGPPLQRGDYGGDIVASSVWFVNWRFADRSVDYHAEGIGASPVQHFWSLSVEEQFYLLWPLLLLLVALVVRRTGIRLRVLATATLMAIVVPSFVWSVFMSHDEPARAFFVTTTRLWELGIGALLSIAAPLASRVPQVLARIMAWVGLAVIVASAFVFEAADMWPGYLALAPTLGTAAVIFAGSRSQQDTPFILRLKPMVWVGAISYSLYLWHWPLLVAAGWQWGEFGQKVGLAVVAFSFVPAWLSYRLVENPLRRLPVFERVPQLAVSIGINLAVLGVVGGLVLAAAVPRASATEAPDSDTLVNLGARSLQYDGERVSGVELVEDVVPTVPDLLSAPDDRMQTTADCHANFETVEPDPCVHGAVDGQTRIFLAGDSKAAQWGDAVEAVASRNGWRFESATKSACAFTEVLREDGDGRPYEACPEFSKNLTSALIADPPDVLVVSQRHSTGFDSNGDLSTDVMVDGLVNTWSTLEEAGIDIVVLLDNPAPAQLPSNAAGNVLDCLATHVADPWSCAFPFDVGFESSGATAQLAAAELVPGVDVIDMSDTLCNPDLCPLVIGGVLVYRQGSHITNTYAMSTIDVLEDRLASVFELAG